MKSLAILIATAWSMTGALAQGTVNFQNTATTLIQIIVNAPAVPAPVGSLTVGLYYGPAGTTDPTTMTLLATTGIGPLPGRYAGGTVTTPNTTAGGAAAVFEVRAWTGAFTSYEGAVASGDPSVCAGRSGLITVGVTGNPAGTPPTTPATLGAPGFIGCEIPVIPEPSTFTIGLLGAGVLFAQHLNLRRRKSSPQ